MNRSRRSEGSSARVEVVEHEHERAGVRRVPEEGAHRIEQAEARALRLQRRGLREARGRARATREAAGRDPPPRRRAAPAAPRARSHEHNSRSDCTHGQYAGAPPASQQRPTSTRAAAPPAPFPSARRRAGSCRFRARPQRVPDDRVRRGRLRDASNELGQLALAPHEHPRRARGGDLRAAAARSSAGSCCRIAACSSWSVAARSQSRAPRSERVAGLLVGLERLGLASRAVEGEHQLVPEALPQRLLRPPGPAARPTSSACAAELQVRRDPVLVRGRAQFVEPRDLALAERLIREIGQRLTAPQAQRLGQRGGPGARIARRQRPAALGDERLEPAQVELARLQLQLVARTDASRSAASPTAGRARAPCATAIPPPEAPSSPPRGPPVATAPRSNGRWRRPRWRAATAFPEARAAWPRPARPPDRRRTPPAGQGCGSPCGFESSNERNTAVTGS